VINYLFLFSLISCLLQGSINFNYESKYGDGSNVNDFTQDTTSYNYFENFLDINFNYNNFYIYTQLEYSNPPIYGYDKVKAGDLANSYFIEYSNSSLMFKWGHLRSIYGYGLNINMFQDQTTDFDNRVKGVELKYSPNDIVDLFFISGKGNYGIKSYGDLRMNDIDFDHSLNTYGIQLYNDLGDFSISSSNKKTYYSGGIYNKLINDSRLSIDLEDHLFDDFSIYDSLINSDSQVESNGINFTYSQTLGNFDIYIEATENTYSKILRENENENGYLRYFSLSGDLFGLNLLYEYKDYNMLYYMPIISNPPLVFGEATSVLMSRIQHSINFADEIGHQLEARFNSKDNISFLINLSMGMKHSGVRNQNEFSFDDEFNLIYETYNSVSFKDFFGKLNHLNGGMNFLDKDLRAHKPFRDLYLETSLWNSDNTLYYKLGYHSHFSYDDASGKNYQTHTIPTQYVIALQNQNSLTIYAEYQSTKNLVANGESYNQDIYTYNYMAVSYHIKNLGNISYFIDKEKVKHYIDDSYTNRNWSGMELSLELSSTMQLSIFKGSQKGGLVCANGVCAVQPSFEDGIKVTFRALF